MDLAPSGAFVEVQLVPRPSLPSPLAMNSWPTTHKVLEYVGSRSLLQTFLMNVDGRDAVLFRVGRPKIKLKMCICSMCR